MTFSTPIRRFVLVLALLLLAAGVALAQWRPLGPYGGNARVLAADPFDPNHILLGSGAGAIFESADGGRHWHSFAQVGSGYQLMLKILRFDPTRRGLIYAAGWSITGSGGGFFLSQNSGRSWTEPDGLRGKSIQALALANSMAGMLVAGSLDGLYRSLDWGESWKRITPAGHPDLKNFESVVIDPADPRIIYTGTWHLPWKTIDGGAHWSNIKQGVIDDSDVFSIILDHHRPKTVYASACSGIYKSDDGGRLFHKIQGIPGSARRTRVLQQDPLDANIVYAGTTEGLWKTSDAGQSFRLISPPNFILNDVLIDQNNPQRVLIATDRGGVFASADGGQSFSPSNDGFSQRQVTALLAGPGDDLYASVVNDREFGGVFRRHTGEWAQLGEGLPVGDVYDLAGDPGGALVAATAHGLYVYADQHWRLSDTLLQESKVPSRPSKPSRNLSLVALRPGASVIRRETFTGRVNALAAGAGRWYAATESGVLMSDNQGASWSGGPIDGAKDFHSISVRNRTVAAATLRDVWYRSGNAPHWSRQPLPDWVTRIYAVAVASDDEIWAATREGVLRWLRAGPSHGEWEQVLNGLPSRDVVSIRAQEGLLMAVAEGYDRLYLSRDQGQSWHPEPAVGWEVSSALQQGNVLYVITRQHGILIREPGGAESDKHAN